MANKDIRRINETEASIKANLTNGKSAIESDGEHAHIHRTGGTLYYPANSKSFAGSTTTYADGSFASVALGQGQLSSVRDSGNGIIYESARNGRSDGTHSWRQNTSELGMLSSSWLNMHPTAITLQADSSVTVKATNRIDMTASAGIDIYTPSVLRVNADTTFSGNIVSRGFQLVEGASYQQVVVKSTSNIGGLLLQATGSNASVSINAADAGGSVILTRYGNQGGMTVGSDATTSFYDAVHMRGPYTSIGSDGTSDLIGADLQVVGTVYVQKENADLALFINAKGGGPIATFARNGVGILGITNTAISLNSTTILEKINIVAGNGGANAGDPVWVDATVYNGVQITPTSNSYYALTQGIFGQILAVTNMSGSSTPYLIGDNMLGGFQLSPSSAAFLVCNSNSKWVKTV